MLVDEWREVVNLQNRLDIRTDSILYMTDSILYMKDSTIYRTYWIFFSSLCRSSASAQSALHMHPTRLQNYYH